MELLAWGLFKELMVETEEKHGQGLELVSLTGTTTDVQVPPHSFGHILM